MSITLPPGTKTEIAHATNSLVIASGARKILVEKKGKGYLAHFILRASALTLEIRFGIDGNIQTYTLTELDNLGLSIRIQGHLWLVKIDSINSIFVVVYDPGYLEPFEKTLFLEVRNPTSGSITVAQWEAKWILLPSADGASGEPQRPLPPAAGEGSSVWGE